MFEVLIQQCFTIHCTLQGFFLIGHFYSSFDFWLQLNAVNIFQVYPQPFSLLRCENTEVALHATPVMALWCFGISPQLQMLPVNVVLYGVSSR